MWCHNRLLRGPWHIAWVVVVTAVAEPMNVAHGQTRIAPVISATEQYDTNVFSTPKSRLLPGVQPEDFITTMIPQVVTTSTGRLVDANISVGALVVQYVNNPNLNYGGFNGSGAINLSRVGQLALPSLRSWSVFGTYQYTPSPSAFGGGGAGYGGAGFGGSGSSGVSGVGAQPGQPSPFGIGLVTQRVRTTSYSVGTDGIYALAPTTDFRTSLTYNRISFGDQFQPNSQGQNRLFSTSGLRVSSWLTTRVTATDTLSLTYTHNLFSQQNTFDTDVGAATWSKLWSREFTSTLSGGVTLQEPYTSTNTPTGTPRRVPAYLLPTGTASMTYRSGSSFISAAGEEGGVFGILPTLAGTLPPGGTLARGSYTVTLAYNVGVFPAYVGNSGALLSQVVSLISSVGLTDHLTAQAGANLGYNTQIGATGNAIFKSYGTTETLNYLFTPTLRATLTHNWLGWDQSGVAAAGGTSSFSFSKHTILLGLTYVFGGQREFFRSETFFGSSPTGPGLEPGPSKSDTGGSDIKK